MAVQEHPIKLAITLPWWQVITVLVGFPILYFANNFTPWSKGLFVKRDHGYYIPVFCSILLLHWAGVALVFLFVSQAGGGLTEIGLPLSARKAAVMVGIFLLVAAALVFLRQGRPANDQSRLPAGLPPLLPVNLGERIFWMFASVSAGICEELVYRGFGLCALRGNGVPTWLAVVLCSLAFVLVHGLWGLRKFWFYFIAGLLYSALFLWVQDLTPGIWIHTLWDLGFMFAG